MNALKKGVFFLLQSATIGLALAFIVVLFKPDWFAQRDGMPVRQARTLSDDERARSRLEVTSYADAVEKATPAVVNVHTAKRVARASNPLFDDPLYRRLFGDANVPQQERIETSLGSGVIISDRGYVLTNNHVIADAEAIQVALFDGRVAPARVVGSDPETDLALLFVDLKNLPAITIGDDTDLRVGDVVLAIGNPYGLGQTVTQGIVSATGRNYLGLNIFENFIQTDAAINPGNSGGALINAYGDLVGINTAFFTRAGGSQGIGFAIPVALARGVMEHLIEYGRVIRGWLGVTPAGGPAVGASGPIVGVVVGAVVPGSPAASAGLGVGDVITHLDGDPVLDGRDALNRVASMRPGTVVELEVLRDGRAMTIEATIGERKTVDG